MKANTLFILTIVASTIFSSAAFAGVIDEFFENLLAREPKHEKELKSQVESVELKRYGLNHEINRFVDFTNQQRQVSDNISKLLEQFNQSLAVAYNCLNTSDTPSALTCRRAMILAIARAKATNEKLSDMKSLPVLQITEFRGNTFSNEVIKQIDASVESVKRTKAQLESSLETLTQNEIKRYADHLMAPAVAAREKIERESFCDSVKNESLADFKIAIVNFDFAERKSDYYAMQGAVETMFAIVTTNNISVSTCGAQDKAQEKYLNATYADYSSKYKKINKTALLERVCKSLKGALSNELKDGCAKKLTTSEFFYTLHLALTNSNKLSSRGEK